MTPSGIHPASASSRPGGVSAKDVPALEDPRAIRAVQEYLADLEAGRRPDRQEFLNRHPELADMLAGCLDALEFVHSAAGSSHPEAAVTAPAADLSAAMPLGDFRVVREIGRGGMGIVYEAEQVSLDRRVALKVLPYTATMDPKQLQRFRNEAKAAASLHHQNIVPVYAVGCERGVHYYAMQFIDGQSLAEVLRGLRRQRDPREAGEATCEYRPGHASPTPPAAVLSTEDDQPRGREFYRNVARMVAHAADAVEHAHSMGIVHRDIKPGNVLLDSAGKVWVADFGLARFGPDAGLTMSGDLLGTLRYMAPEQALTKHGLVDHRADVYGLGATLYELLTLRPAIEAEDRREVLRQIAFEEPVPPRRLECTVPVELETIALKALAKDPAERYASAGELCVDLCRYLEDRPILARRPTARQRLGRWARRHRQVVVTGVAALALLTVTVIAGLVISNALVTHERDQTRGAERAGRHRLYEAYFSQGQANRWNGQLGARADGLGALEKAVGLAAGLDLGHSERLRLRNEVVALLALPDFHVVKRWVGFPPGSRRLAFDVELGRYARCDDGNTVSVRRVGDDCELFRLPPSGDGGPAVAELKFSPCGRFLLCGQHRARRTDVVVWDLDRRVDVLTVAGGFDAAFRPDGGAVAVSHVDGTVRIHDLPGGEEWGRVPAGGRSLLVAFNGAGTLLAVNEQGGQELQIWDAATQTFVQRVAAPGRVLAFAWHPDGRRFAVGCSGQQGLIYCHDLDTGRWSGAWTGHQSACVRLSFHPAGHLLASEGWDSTVRLWDARDGRQLLCLPDQIAPAFGRDGRLATRHGRYTAVIDPGDRATYRRLSFPGVRIEAVAIHPNDRLVVAAGSALAAWDLAAGRELPVVQESAVSCVFFDPSTGDLITSGSSGVQRRAVADSDSPAGPMRIGPPELLRSAGRNGVDAALSADGKTLVVVDGPSRTADAIAPGTREGFPLPGIENMRYPAVSRDGRWAAVGSNFGREVRVWDTRTRNTAHPIPHAIGAASRVAFDPDGHSLLVSVLGEFQLLEVGSWRERWRAGGDAAGDVHAPAGLIAFSPGGEVVAVRHNRLVIRLLDPATGRELADLTAPDLGLLCGLAFGPGGRLLAAATENGTVHLWDLRRVRERLAVMGFDWGPRDTRP